MTSESGPETILGRRALNRATLARQHLLRRTTAAPLDVIEHLVGMQAQAPLPPYFGLWSRVQGFRPDDLVQLLMDRRAVRVVLMRGTVHLVSAADCLALRPLLSSMLERQFRANTAYGPRLAGMDLREVADAGRALLDERPRTTVEVGTLLAERWPDRDPAALAQAIRSMVPLVQVPPRGIWGLGGQPVCATGETWLGRPMAQDASVDEMVLRYLAAFGPATAGDVQTWCGLTRLREVLERLRPRLCAFRDEQGRELFDIPKAPRPDPETPAPPVFLAAFDNVLLSYADRTRVISEEHRRVVFTQNGLVKGTILIDGDVAGFWEVARRRRTSTLTITPFIRLARRTVTALEAEGERLLGFAAADGDTRELRFIGA